MAICNEFEVRSTSDFLIGTALLLDGEDTGLLSTEDFCFGINTEFVSPMSKESTCKFSSSTRIIPGNAPNRSPTKSTDWLFFLTFDAPVPLTSESIL